MTWRTSTALAVSLYCLTSLAQAEDQGGRGACQAAAGQYLVATVVSPPTFAHGHRLHGIELSHTRLVVRADDGTRYQIAADNVYASGYDPQVEQVPPPLNGLRTGDRLSLCGRPFPGGMHWVHTNCGAPPQAKDPNGWMRLLDASGAAGENLEGSQTYCELWHHRR